MTVKTDLPVKPFIGLAFRPDGTNSVATIKRIDKKDVTYTFAHDPNVYHTRPYAEVRHLGWLAE